MDIICYTYISRILWSCFFILLHHLVTVTIWNFRLSFQLFLVSSLKNISNSFSASEGDSYTSYKKDFQKDIFPYMWIIMWKIEVQTLLIININDWQIFFKYLKKSMITLKLNNINNYNKIMKLSNKYNY